MSRVLTAAQRREPRAPSPPAQDYRKELWIRVATALARAENCRNATVPGDWADAALEAFDRTFVGQR